MTHTTCREANSSWKASQRSNCLVYIVVYVLCRSWSWLCIRKGKTLIKKPATQKTEEVPAQIIMPEDHRTDSEKRYDELMAKRVSVYMSISLKYSLNKTPLYNNLIIWDSTWSLGKDSCLKTQEDHDVLSFWVNVLYSLLVTLIWIMARCCR